MRAALGELGRGLSELFQSGTERTWFTLLCALLLQVLWWSRAAAGQPGLAEAAGRVAWTVLLFLLVPLLLSRLLRARPAELGLQTGDRRFGAGITMVGVPLTVLLGWLATADPVFQTEYPWTGPGIAATPVLLLVWCFMYAGYYLAYEFFFRGFLQGLLSRGWGPVNAIWLQTVASALIHLGKPFPELLAAIPAGLLFGVIAWRSRSILWPFLIHLALGLATDLSSLLRQGAFQ